MLQAIMPKSGTVFQECYLCAFVETMLQGVSVHRDTHFIGSQHW